MPISVQCPGCGKRLTAKDELAGKNATCPGCKKVMVIPAARPLSQSKSPAPAEPATTFSPAIRRRKRNLLPLYIGGGIAALCLVIVLVVIFSTSGGDRSIAKNADPVPKTGTTPKAETKPAPQPEVAKTETTRKPETESAPEPQSKPEADRKPSAKFSAEEKSPDKSDKPDKPEKPNQPEKPDKPVAKTADVPKAPPVDRQSIEQVENLMKELGFTVTADLGESPGTYAPGPDGKDYEFNIWTCENRAAGSTLLLTRNMTLDVATHVPGPRYEIRASHREKDRNALVELCGKISPSLEEAVRGCIAQYERTKKPVEKSVEKVKVYVDRTGAYIESIPAVIPRIHIGAAGGIKD